MDSPNLAALLERTTQTSGKARVAISRWPIRAASLRALSDLGLTDVKIADYLKVDTEQVTSWRRTLESVTPVEAGIGDLIMYVKVGHILPSYIRSNAAPS